MKLVDNKENSIFQNPMQNIKKEFCFFFFVFLKLTNFREAGNLSSSIVELKSDAWKYLYTRTEPHETRETLFIDELKQGVQIEMMKPDAQGISIE